MNPVLSLALLLASPQMAVGQEDEIKKALARCAALHIETARLDCFEQLARAVTQIPFKPPNPPVSKANESARDVPTVSPSEAANHIGEEVIVEGVIFDVGYSARSDTTFLNMGGKYPNHTFTAVIPESAKPLFPEARSWEGQKVRIRGVVKEFLSEILDRADVQDAIRGRILAGDTAAFLKAIEIVYGRPGQAGWT
jgi:hypothetical protein